MAETKVLSPTEVAEEHQKEAHAPYFKIWVGLLIFTLIEYFYAFIAKDVFVILLAGLLLGRRSKPEWWAGTSCT